LISVCLASFNGARFIGAQLASILASPQVGELLVSDDGSTDGTRDILAGVRDPRLHLLQGPRRGVIANFEFLLRQAGGEQIFLADQDDVWLEGKVPAMSNALRDADLAVCDCSVVDAELNVLQPSFFAARGSGPGLLKNLWRNSFLGCCLAFRRSVLAGVLPFPAAVPMHDWWIGLQASRRGRVAFLPQRLVLYRRHDGNATEALHSSASRLTQLRWRMRMAGALLARSA
jgi:glycosyltransferase involved in cell wall biosynthesis